MPNRNRFATKRAGSSLSITMMFFAVIAMVTLTAVGVSTTNDAMAQRSVEKTQATALSESGIQVLYDQICRDAVALQFPTKAVSQNTVNTMFSGKTRLQGGFSAKVLNVDSVRTSPAPGYSKGSVQYIDTYQVEGTGTAKNGTTSITRATFRLKRVYNNDGTPGAGAVSVEFPGVINSNTDIKIVTNAGVRTQDPAGTNKSASIVANTGITWTPFSGSKTSYVNPNIIDIQGQILVPNQPDTSIVDYTKGISGLGNPNGTKNYQSASSMISAGASYDANSNEITGMGQSKYYLGLKELIQLKADLLTQAQTAPGSTTYGSVSSSSVAFDSTLGRKIIKAPAVIAGNLDIAAGDHIHFVPRSTKVDDNVIYVTGNVTNRGELSNMGVKFVVLGQYTDGPNAVYQLGTQNSPYASLSEVYKNGGFISFNQRVDAIKITSNASAQYGNVYAAAGGILITGNLEINGILTSGGPAKYATNEIWADQPSGRSTNAQYGGGVQILPNNGGSFVMNYIREAKEFKIGAGNGNIAQTLLEPIRADRLTDWRRIR
ncbi:MAG: hypothetical protein JSS71_01560 [Armatimonadetes bacterium]|nr:hypothetical protein [Armatimonadota bacterium]MBX3108970.1 hypothetical protein [Fimbriimonadaceae bacterium]